jgi:DNA-binding transcriptional ArsR family regulator
MSGSDEDIQRLVEEGLGSPSRLRILRILSSGEEASQTKYGLERKTGLKPVDVRKHLKILVETGWVKEHEFDPPVYTVNLENQKARFLVDFFRRIGIKI